MQTNKPCNHWTAPAFRWWAHAAVALCSGMRSRGDLGAKLANGEQMMMVRTSWWDVFEDLGLIGMSSKLSMWFWNRFWSWSVMFTGMAANKRNRFLPGQTSSSSHGTWSPAQMTETEKRLSIKMPLAVWWKWMTGSGREKAECTGLPPNPAWEDASRHHLGDREEVWSKISFREKGYMSWR